MWMEIVTPYSKFVFYINKKRKQNKLFKNKKVLIFSRSKSKYKKKCKRVREEVGKNKPGNNK